jgi:hypothetical protein
LIRRENTGNPAGFEGIATRRGSENARSPATFGGEFPGPWNRERRPSDQGASRRGQGSPRGLFQARDRGRLGVSGPPPSRSFPPLADPAGGTASARSR